MAKVTTTELENIIRAKIQEKGLTSDITEERIKEIKDSIKSKIREAKASTATAEEETVVDIPVDVPSEEPGSIPDSVTSMTSTDPKATELAQKEGELSQKTVDVSAREAQVSNRESELQRKQDEMDYKPQVPEVLEDIGPEKVFVFDTNEISLGAEALSQTEFKMVKSPDEKNSMHDLWIKSGVRQTEVYKVNFEKIGTVTFDPFKGTSVFEKNIIENPEVENSVPEDGLTPEDARQSQEAPAPMDDAIEPTTDVTLPATQDMGLDSVDMQSSIDKKIEDILRDYLKNKG